MATTALVHGALGEKRLIQPLLALDQGIMAVDLARRVFRFAWHAMSVLPWIRIERLAFLV
eukprot:gene45502-56678_t